MIRIEMSDDGDLEDKLPTLSVRSQMLALCTETRALRGEVVRLTDILTAKIERKGQTTNEGAGRLFRWAFRGARDENESVRVTLNMLRQDFEKLKRLAQEDGETVSGYLRNAIATWI